jgi:hypothetical protein
MFDIGVGGSFCAMLLAYSLGFWFGAHCLLHTDRCPESLTNQKYTARSIFSVVFNTVIIDINMSQFPGCLKKLV